MTDPQSVTPTNTTAITLGATARSEVESAFRDARDFRGIGERITSPLDSLISQTASIIDRDPIMNVSDELAKMNASVQTVYGEILNNDGTVMRIAKSLPIIGSLAQTLDAKWDEAAFNIKGIEGKIGTIFSGFDQAYASLNTSIDLQRQFLDGIDANLGTVVAYKEFLTVKIEEFRTRLAAATDENEKMKLEVFLQNVEYFQSNLVVLIGNLEMARKRLLMRLSAASKLSLAMNSSRPIFKTLLSTALIETSSQKALDASMKAMDAMGKTIDRLSSELTDRAIEASKRSEEISAKPVLSASVFIDNVTKLKNHFDEIESYRAQVQIEAEKEKGLFADAKKQLDGIKTISAKSQEELAGELQGGTGV